MVIKQPNTDIQIELTSSMIQVFLVEGEKYLLLEQIQDDRPVEEKLRDYLRGWQD